MTEIQRDVVVVGGGVAGLSCAYRLSEDGRDVLLLEKESVAGGNIRTGEEAGYRLERGPHTFLGSADGIFELAEKCGLRSALRGSLPSARNRFIVRGGRLHAAPMGLWSFVTTPLLSSSAKWTLATEPWRRSRGAPDDSAATFFKRRFGSEAARILAGAFISGVYAGDPDQLSARAAFPLFWGFEQETGSMVRGALRHNRRRRRELSKRGVKPRKGLFSFERGLGQFTATLSAALGKRCVTNAEVHSVAANSVGYTIKLVGGDSISARALVVAAPPGPAAQILADVDADLAHSISGVPMAPVAVVHLGFAKVAREIPDGFGFLVPRGEGVRTLGVLFPSRLFNGRAPNGGDLLAGFVGGTLDREALELSDDDLIQIVRSDLRDLTGLEQPQAFVKIRRYPAAIPQLVNGHLERMFQVAQRLESTKNLFLAGNYLTGVGMKDATASGLAAAVAVTRLLDSGQ